MGKDLKATTGDYADLLHNLKERIRAAQVRASLSINRELVLLYWQIGRDILARQEAQGWGAKVIDRLAVDLRREFPEMRGFSSRNLKYMRALAEAYSDAEFVQQAVAQIPWGHNVRILDHLKNNVEREWYIRQTVQNGWSRDVLVHHIESESAMHNLTSLRHRFTLRTPHSAFCNESLRSAIRNSQ
jgi:predicted nuclease of restriction endonuclease-like (RecB) superfamily